MAHKTLVIVESPTKAKTITKFLGKDYIVKASMGHIRDLPNSASEIPEKLKKEKWTKLGVNIEKNFDPLYIIPPKKKDQVKKLKESLKDATELLLATDEDREGESISWHLLETLNPKIPIKRLVFHEITKDAISKALASTREVDMNLVRAQETRRIIDRLYGYEVSPVLWKKIAPRLSAGRVQSVALRLLVERERERIKFVSADYWDLKAKANTNKKEVFDTDVSHVDGVRLAQGKDFDADTGKLKSADKVKLLGEKEANEVRDRILDKTATVKSVDKKPFSSQPPAPFVTSSLQQESNRKLRYSAQRTMRIAQQLYENGFITYMRTDSTTLSDEAIKAARSFVAKEYGQDYLPSAPRTYATKVKNAQEAHEAIRPAGAQFTSPAVVMEKLGDEAFKLYDLIWKRTVASQMENAKGTYINVNLLCEGVDLRASGKTIEFPGFLRAYVEGSDDPDSDIADQERILPDLKVGDALMLSDVKSVSHSTLPPARYTEGSLIRELEKKGIGRPSTWAAVVELILYKTYAFKKGTALVPSYTAMAIVSLLEEHFHQLVDYDFTARLEDELDSISRGEGESIKYLKSFYFGNGHKGLKELIVAGVDNIDPREINGIFVGKDSNDTTIEVRVGKYGPFLSDGTRKASVPEGTAPDEMTMEKAEEILAIAEKGPDSLGAHPTTGEPVYLKVGRYGPYVQLGDPDLDDKKKPKPKMSSLLAGMTLEEVNLELAVKLLELPKELGKFPETEDAVLAKNGPYGPYIESGKERRSIPAGKSPITITLEEAVELLKQPKTRGRASAPQALKELGLDPVSGNQVKLLSGRYGPYVSNEVVNASLPKGVDPMTYSLENSLELLRQRELVAPTKKPRKSKKK